MMTATQLSPAEPVSQLRHVRIVECGEALVDFLELCPELVFDRDRFLYRRETLLRTSVAERLCRAARCLPEGYRLAVIEGWRAPHIQRRMYRALWNRFQHEHPDWSETRLKRVVNRFSAPMDRRVPPPHTTGGAVDVMLADASGAVLDHSSPYDPFDMHQCSLDAPGLSETARKTRTILAKALLRGGLTNYPSEYWHWSYGDQGWAYRGGHPNAIYGAIEPTGYMPREDENIDTPLESIE
jgi:D-alanyl-D-alanine dipeptidase